MGAKLTGSRHRFTAAKAQSCASIADTWVSLAWHNQTGIETGLHGVQVQMPCLKAAWRHYLRTIQHLYPRHAGMCTKGVPLGCLGLG